MPSATIAFLAGILTTLSPCVLPALPIVVGSAAGKHRWGPVMVAAGMVLSFSILGVFLASVGFSLGLEEQTLRSGAAALFVFFGLLLLSSGMQRQLSRALSPLASASDRLINRFESYGLWGQFAVGLLLGAVWSPCTGPTLGVAVGLAAQEGTRATAATIFFLFGLGAAIPLLLIAYGSRKLLLDKINAASNAASAAKTVFGSLMLIVGLLVISGTDKLLETLLLEVSPDWLIKLTVGI